MGKYQYVRKTATYDGKRFEATGKTELEAMTKLAEKLAAAKRGENIISPNMTVSAWYKKWKEAYKDPKGLTEKSLSMYDQKFNGYIKPRIGSMRLQDVREIHLQKILNEEAGKSSSHVKKIRMIMKEMFRRARQSRLVNYDPSEFLELPMTKTGFRRSLTEEEREAVLSVAEKHRCGTWVLTLLYTGMRPGESAALRWRDVDLANAEIHINAAIESGTNKIKGPKTAAGVRTIPIRKVLLEKLTAAKKGKKKDDLVFPSSKGKVATGDLMQQWWHSFSRDVDIYMGAVVYRNKIVESKLSPGFTPYVLRHTFATDAQRAGVPINVAKELMGHTDISVTANIYTHHDTQTAHENIKKMDEKGL